MTKCKEITRKIARGEYAEARWHERLAIRLHLLMCRFCRRYAEQLRAIGAGARNLHSNQREDSATLKRLEGRILERARPAPEDTPKDS